MASRSTSEELDLDSASCGAALQQPGLFPTELDQPALSEDWWPLSEVPLPEAEGLACAALLEPAHGAQPTEHARSLQLDSQGSLEPAEPSQPAEPSLDEAGSGGGEPTTTGELNAGMAALLAGAQLASHTSCQRSPREQAMSHECEHGSEAGGQIRVACAGFAAGEDELQSLLDAQASGQGSGSGLPGLHEPQESASETEASDTDSDSDVVFPGAAFCINCTSRMRGDFCEASPGPEPGARRCWLHSPAGHLLAVHGDLLNAHHALVAITCTSSPDQLLLQSCQREAADDDGLFAHSLGQLAVPASTARGGVALVFDERMQLHAECRPRPHPERPDRIRAVIARLMSSGLAGAPLRPCCSRSAGSSAGAAAAAAVQSPSCLLVSVLPLPACSAAAAEGSRLLQGAARACPAARRPPRRSSAATMPSCCSTWQTPQPGRPACRQGPLRCWPRRSSSWATQPSAAHLPRLSSSSRISSCSSGTRLVAAPARSPAFT